LLALSLFNVRLFPLAMVEVTRDYIESRLVHQVQEAGGVCAPAISDQHPGTRWDESGGLDMFPKCLEHR
jgi:hypothetical protein